MCRLCTAFICIRDLFILQFFMLISILVQNGCHRYSVHNGWKVDVWKFVVVCNEGLDSDG